MSLGFTILGEIFAYVTVLFNPTTEVVKFPSSWMVHVGCTFFASIHPSRTQDLLGPCNRVHV